MADRMSDKSPFDIARETLRLLSTRKLAPDPVNFQKVYGEVAGVPAVPAFPDEPLRQIAQALPGRNASQLKQKGLLESAIGKGSWTGVRLALVAYLEAGAAPAAGSASNRVPPSAVDLLGQVARLIENVLPALGEDDVRFSEQAVRLLQAMRDPALGLAGVKPLLDNFILRVSFAAEDQAEIRATLLKLLHVIIQNLGEFTLDESWLKRPLEALVTAATPPLTLRRLDDVERHMKNVVFKQVEARQRELQAQGEMRELLAMFVDRLAQMTEDTSVRQGRMEDRKSTRLNSSHSS